MDHETKTIFRQNISAWCERNAAALAEIEKASRDRDRAAKLFADLQGLGVLHILYHFDMGEGLAMVAESANCVAQYSPSLALLVVQQNMAARILASCGAAEPAGWVALPLYDSPAEWRGQVAVARHGDAVRLDGAWGAVPGLPIADSCLLPLEAAEADDFAMLRIDLGDLPPGVSTDAAEPMLGHRGCPCGDLRFAGAAPGAAALFNRGPAHRRALVTLWSQAEIFMAAIRAAILARCYAVAREHVLVRWQGGKLIVEHSLVRKMLAELHLATHRFGDTWAKAAEAAAPDEALTTGQLAMMLQSAGELPRLTSLGIQLLGGLGYMEDMPQERLFRDAKQSELLLGRPHFKQLAVWQKTA